MKIKLKAFTLGRKMDENKLISSIVSVKFQKAKDK